MKILNYLPASIFSIFGVLSPILDWIFNDKSLQEITVENSINEIEEEYKEAMESVRNGEKEEVTISLKNGDTLTVKSMK